MNFFLVGECCVLPVQKIVSKVLMAVQNLATTSKAALAWLIAHNREPLFRAHFGEQSERGLRCATILVKVAQAQGSNLGNVPGLVATACKVLEREAARPAAPQLDQALPSAKNGEADSMNGSSATFSQKFLSTFRTFGPLSSNFS